ncbi:MAG TPA: beta-ketoacyl-ACP synthase II [Candidatus Dormibacteraeota bacterium]|nr:beta-ketoacyl-ACP synthase II [Candidatus Dormibacteraeota bacterium]
MSRDGRRVVVTGMGTLNPLGKTVDEYWDGLVEGRSGAALIEGFDATRLTTKFACEVRGFDPTDYMDRKLVQRSARFTHLAIASCGQAIADAELDLAGEDRYRVGVEMGTGIGGFEIMTRDAATYLNGGRLQPLYATMVIPNIAAAQVAMTYGLRGPNSTTVTACAASTHAIGNALRVIQRGDADVMLAAGTEASMCEVGIASFNAIKALSTRNDSPESASRPFDRDRDGFVPGEGAGTLVLESLEHAQRRGARVHGEVIGFGITNDAFHAVAPDESGAAPAQCIRNALADAGVAPEEVDYINAHGTSTPLNDAAETRAMKMVLGDYAYKVPISSTKSMIGHLLGAAGAVEAIATLLSINRGVIHPTINYKNPDPACDLDYVPNHARRADVRIAISNGFGFGGQNCTIVLKRFEE